MKNRSTSFYTNLQNQKGLLLLAFSFLCINILTANSRFIQVAHTYKVEILGEMSKIELLIPIPKDYEGRQKIHHIGYSRRPQSTFQEFGTQYAKYVFNNVKKDIYIDISLHIELLDYDWAIANEQLQSPKPLKKRAIKRLTKNNGLYKLSEDFIMPMIIQESSDRNTKVKAIHNYVVDHLEYQTFFGKDLGASHALDMQKGDCTEYAALMIALCRKEGIPARQVNGFTIANTTGVLGSIFRSSGHAWVEVYLDGLGWTPFDPTHSDGSNTTNFKNLQNKYIYISKDNEEGNMKWLWWGYGGQVQVQKDRNWKEFASVGEMNASIVQK